MTGYGLVLFLPQIVSRFGVGVGMNGLISALPFAAAAVAMVLWGLHSDRTGERNLHAAAACFLNFAGLAVCVFLQDPTLMMIAIILARWVSRRSHRRSGPCRPPCFRARPRPVGSP